MADIQPQDSPAKAQARATVNEIKAKSEAGKAEQQAVAEQSLAVISQNKNMSKLYQDNAQVGADNLGGVMPLLKIHSVGRSSKNELAEGGEPHDGWFFYAADGTQYQNPICHILSISAGFRAP